ncbi:MAG: ATP-binding protein [Planctomycetota bacterium]
MPSRAYLAEVPADASCLRAVRAFAAAVLAKEQIDESERLVLALDEACANIVKHRCPTIEDGRICVRLELTDATLRFRIGGFCKPGDVPKVKPRDFADIRPGGLGTAFIGEIMDRVAFEPDPERGGAMELVMERARRSEDDV